jgi:hypothetical protein
MLIFDPIEEKLLPIAQIAMDGIVVDAFLAITHLSGRNKALAVPRPLHALQRLFRRWRQLTH